MTYLDANASEPLRPEARAAVLAALDLTGNPSSIHAAGRAARRVLEDARAAVARRFGAATVVWTSGGTEADAQAVAGLGAGRRLVVGATEHDAVAAAAPGAMVMPVDGDGVADLDWLRRTLRDGPPALVCLMLANNETGTLQPVAEAAALCRAHGALLHVDAVQARDGADLRVLGAHSMAVSSHKLGGPKGAGALLLADGVEVPPLIVGGGQERGRRGGTPALPAIAGFAAAAGCAWPDLRPLRDAVAERAVAHGAVLLGGPHRLSNTACLARPGLRADLQVIALDLAGVQVSAGAACSSGKVGRSRVLDAMGAGALAGEAVRVSLPWNAVWGDVERFGAAYAGVGQKESSRING